MSMDYYVLCDRPLASVQEWRQAIDELGFDLKIKPDCDVATMKGFLPVTWRGHEAGFECAPFRFSSLQETYEHIDFGRTWPVVYVMYAGSLGGSVGALIAAAAIVRKTGGRVFDPQDSLIAPPEEAARHAAKVEAEILALQARGL